MKRTILSLALLCGCGANEPPKETGPALATVEQADCSLPCEISPLVTNLQQGQTVTFSLKCPDYRCNWYDAEASNWWVDKPQSVSVQADGHFGFATGLVAYDCPVMLYAQVGTSQVVAKIRVGLSDPVTPFTIPLCPTSIPSPCPPDQCCGAGCAAICGNGICEYMQGECDQTCPEDCSGVMCQ